MAAPVSGSNPVSSRDEWFDRFARRTAGGMSRRESVGWFAGTAATAIFGSLIKPGSALAAAAFGQGKDSGCTGTRASYSEGCSKPVPKLNYKPAENGCGPQKGFDPVPDRPLNIANFKSACNG